MNDLVSIPLFRAIGWTLIHSLWQGALLALLAGIALRLTRKRSADLRYALAFGTLALLVLTFGGTLAWVLGGHDPLSATGSFTISAVSDGPDATRWMPQLRAVIGPWIPWLLMGWIFGFTFRMVQLGRAMVWLYGPALGSLQLPPVEWLTRFDALRQRSGVQVAVRLGLSDRVDSLVVLGWLKPVVLIPTAALMALSPEGLEALLVHELAHIRRNDFLANVLQTFAEALLFYHPAVWWLSRRIRQEREHCCDDAAVQACGNPLLYASALARLEELRTQPFLIPDLVPAASGGRLMFRIQRLLRPRPTTDLTPSIAALLPPLLFVLALGVVTLSASSPGAPPKSEPAPVELESKQVKVRYQSPRPPYPEVAKAAKIQGTVQVRLTIGKDGKVTKSKALEGPPQLKAFAEDWARGWEFEPATVKGKSVPARFNLTILCKLH